MRPKTEDEIELMRSGGAAIADIFTIVLPQIKEGLTTGELAQTIESEYKKHSLVSAVIGYEGFPGSVCISINNEVVHGIPSKKRVIRSGDVLTLDLTAINKGMIVDSARTICVGKSKNRNVEIGHLISGTEEALKAGINEITGRGTRVGSISAAIQESLEAKKLGVVKDLVGHGVGYSIHEEPNIPNYGQPGMGPSLIPGMTIAVEPMATLGDWRVDILPDGWTVVTRDGSLAAHFEHTVLITEHGYEILTA